MAVFATSLVFQSGGFEWPRDGAHDDAVSAPPGCCTNSLIDGGGIDWQPGVAVFGCYWRSSADHVVSDGERAVRVTAMLPLVVSHEWFVPWPARTLRYFVSPDACGLILLSRCAGSPADTPGESIAPVREGAKACTRYVAAGPVCLRPSRLRLLHRSHQLSCAARMPVCFVASSRREECESDEEWKVRV